jgi:hypothetical protein
LCTSRYESFFNAETLSYLRHILLYERGFYPLAVGGRVSQPKRFLRQAQDVSHGFWLRLRSQRSSRVCFHSDPKGTDIESKCARIRSKFDANENGNGMRFAQKSSKI